MFEILVLLNLFITGILFLKYTTLKGDFEDMSDHVSYLSVRVCELDPNCTVEEETKDD